MKTCSRWSRQPCMRPAAWESRPGSSRWSKTGKRSRNWLQWSGQSLTGKVMICTSRKLDVYKRQALQSSLISLTRSGLWWGAYLPGQGSWWERRWKRNLERKPYLSPLPPVPLCPLRWGIGSGIMGQWWQHWNDSSSQGWHTAAGKQFSNTL